MKRAASLIIALVLFIITCFGTAFYCNAVISEKKEEITYYNTDFRNFSKEALEKVFGSNSIPVFGSSELSAFDEVAYPPSLFKGGNSDFNMVLIGRGGTQCLHHAISLGAVSDVIPKKKVVLILSPQWFTDTHLSSEVYASRFSERMYSGFLKNPKISYVTKEKVTERVKSLLASDPKQLKRVDKYEKVYMKYSVNPILQTEVRIYDSFMNFRQNYTLSKEIKDLQLIDKTQESVKSESINFDALMKKAVEAGEEACTNNNFYIYDEYYDTYIKETEESKKGASTGGSYLVSPEYDDLRLFLAICRETEIEPLIISIPVNGRWYDWTGFPKENREGYYQNIRNICTEYGVELADFSDKEYEEYFLSDIMHLGWKGWVYLDEAVYRFYKE